MVKTLKSARQMHLYFTEIPQIQGDFPWPPGIVANDSEVVTRLLVTACWKDKPSLKKSMSGNLPSGTSAGKRLEWNRTEFEITWGHGFIFVGLYCMRWCPIRSCAVPQSSSGKAEVSLPRLSRFVWLRNANPWQIAFVTEFQTLQKMWHPEFRTKCHWFRVRELESNKRRRRNF